MFVDVLNQVACSFATVNVPASETIVAVLPVAADVPDGTPVRLVASVSSDVYTDDTAGVKTDAIRFFLKESDSDVGASAEDLYELDWIDDRHPSYIDGSSVVHAGNMLSGDKMFDVAVPRALSKNYLVVVMQYDPTTSGKKLAAGVMDFVLVADSQTNKNEFPS